MPFFIQQLPFAYFNFEQKTKEEIGYSLKWNFIYKFVTLIKLSAILFL